MRPLRSLLLLLAALPLFAAPADAGWVKKNLFGVRTSVQGVDTVAHHSLVTAANWTISSGQSIFTPSINIMGADAVFLMVKDSIGTGTIVANMYAATDSALLSIANFTANSDSLTSVDTLTCNSRFGVCAVNRAGASAKVPYVVRYYPQGVNHTWAAATLGNADASAVQAPVIGPYWAKFRIAAASADLVRAVVQVFVHYPGNDFPPDFTVQGSSNYP